MKKPHREGKDTVVVSITGPNPQMDSHPIGAIPRPESAPSTVKAVHPHKKKAAPGFPSNSARHSVTMRRTAARSLSDRASERLY